MDSNEQRKIFAQNLKNLLNKYKRTQIDVATAINVSPQTFNTWTQGKALPRMGKIQALADYFGVNKSELIDPPSTGWQEGTVKAIRIPVVGMVHAGIPSDAVEDIIDWEEINPDMAMSGEHMALQVKGDCMEPRFCEGDVVIVRRQPDVDSGNIAIIMVNSDEAVMRILKKYEDGSIALVPTNPVYPVSRYTPHDILTLPVTVLGKVVELRAKF